MATERQIEANRLNAARSTGPKTEEGKARSRANATRHGMAGVEADASPEFLERRAKWAEGREPEGEARRWALDRAVAASLRVERCERSLDHVVTLDAQRAELAWDQDRALEAEQTARSLAEEPGLTARKLQTTRAGVEWLIESWLGLVDLLDDGKAWSDAQATTAQDLMGLPRDRRVEAAPAARADEVRVIEIQRAMAMGQIERLEALRDEVFVPIDEAERSLAMSGGRALLSKPAKLILRYERDAWRRYRESMKHLESQDEDRPSPRPGPPKPAPIPIPTPIPPARPKPRAVEGESGLSLEALREENRAMLDQLKASGVTLPEGISDDDDAAWYEEFERQLEARNPAGPTA